MAYFDHKKECPRCKELGVWEHSTYCNLCGEIVEKEKKINHFFKLDSMTVEERLRRIEEWIYSYKPKYISPPRF